MPWGLKLKLTKNKKLMVFFGCVAIEKESEKDEENEEIRRMEYDDIQKEVLSLRTKLIEGLNKSREVRDVSDLFVKLPRILLFNPIVFKMHIPLSLQKTRYVIGESFRAEIEDFEIVYDGYILMVVALCDLNKFPWGVFDVRDRLKKVLGSIVKVKIIAPCLSLVGVTFSMQDDDANKEERRGLFVKISKPTDSKVLLRELYLEVARDLGMFYGASSLTNDIEDVVREIISSESRLLVNLRNFLEADWKQLRKKWGLVSQSKKNMVETFEKLFQYLAYRNRLAHERKEIDRFVIEHNSVSAKLIKDIGLHYAEPRIVIDTDSVVKTIEHVRNEIEAFSLNTSTFLSALVGAVVGSIITLVASYLL